MTREEFVAEFEARLPRRKEMLELIMRALLADRSFRGLVRLVLGVDFDAEPPAEEGNP